jgi:hypothetical protein
MIFSRLPHPEIKLVPNREMELANSRSRAKWVEKSRMIDETLADEGTCALVLKDLARQTMYGDFRRYSLYESSIHATENQALVLSALGKKGKKARRPDAFDLLCADIVKRRPHLSEIDFVQAIKAQHDPFGVVTDVDEAAIYVSIEGKLIQEIPISGLKDRLSRLKKKLRSR